MLLRWALSRFMCQIIFGCNPSTWLQYCLLSRAYTCTLKYSLVLVLYKYTSSCLHAIAYSMINVPIVFLTTSLPISSSSSCCIAVIEPSQLFLLWNIFFLLTNKDTSRHSPGRQRIDASFGCCVVLEGTHHEHA